MMTTKHLVITLVFLSLTTAPQSSEILGPPAVFIETSQGSKLYTGIFGGVYSNKDLNTVPEITRMLYERATEDQVALRVVFDKEKADVVWHIGREDKWNSRKYTWLLIDRETGEAVAWGKENWFRNSVKDMVRYLRLYWNLKGVNARALRAGYSYKASLHLPKKKLKKGKKRALHGTVIVHGTKNPATVIIATLNPEIALVGDSQDTVSLRTSGGDNNRASFQIVGTGKKGQYWINAYIIDVEGEDAAGTQVLSKKENPDSSIPESPAPRRALPAPDVDQARPATIVDLGNHPAIPPESSSDAPEPGEPQVEPNIEQPDREGPFGLTIGATKEDLEQQLGVELEQVEGKPRTYFTKTVPSPHSAFEFYILVVAPKAGLCQARAIGREVATSRHGLEIRQEFEELRETLLEIYGSDEKSDILLPGTIWNEPEDWMMGIVKKERFLQSVWSGEKGSRLPSKIVEIILNTAAQATDSGRLQLQYRFSNYERGEQEIKALEKKSL